MLKDKVYRYRYVSIGDKTELLPYNFFGDHLPVSLNIDDIYNLKGHIPTDGDFNPKRCIYLESIDKYIILDIRGSYSAPAGTIPLMKPEEPDTPATKTVTPAPIVDQPMAMVYLLDGTTHEMIVSYSYMPDTCPSYQLYDEITDMTVGYDEIDDDIKVTFLIVNSVIRSASIARFRLGYKNLGQAHNDDADGNPVTRINLADLDFFCTPIPPGKRDEMALGWSLVSAVDQDMVYIYPQFKVGEMVSKLKSSVYCGQFTPKYCNITVDEAGRYVAMIGSKVRVWMGPFLNFWVDAQYLVIIDQQGMNQHFVYLSPQGNAMSFDEGEEHQPYKHSLTVIDARYLLCLEDRKSRFLNPKRVYVGPQTEPPGDSYTECTKNWEGGQIADVYYPKRAASASPPDGGDIIYIGYPTAWEQTSYQTPVTKESIWTLVDICDVYGAVTDSTAAAKRNYSADIVFVVDTSASMSNAIAQLQENISNFVLTMAGLGVNDYRIGVVSYSVTARAMFSTLTSPASMWATTQAGALNLIKQVSVGVPGGGYAFHSTAIQYAANYYAWRSKAAKYMVIVTDALDEGDPQALLTASAALSSKGIAGSFVGTDANYFDPIWSSTGGSFTSMAGSWGATMAYDLATKIAESTGAIKARNWWDIALAAWQPAVLYQYSPINNFDSNSHISIRYDSFSYIGGYHLIRSRICYLTIYDNYPELNGHPQSSIYIPGLIPGETQTVKYVIKNESKTGTMRKIALTLADIPDDVTVDITGFPERLDPGQVALIQVAATYNPVAPNQGTRHIDVKYTVSYWLQSRVNCSEAKGNVSYIPDTDEDDGGAGNSELYFVPSSEDNELVRGWRKEIGWDPLYTVAYYTDTLFQEGDITMQPGWMDYRIYVVQSQTTPNCLYQALDPQPVTALGGLSATLVGYSWLKITGPVAWETRRVSECRVNKKVWFIVNRSTEASYYAHPVFQGSTLPAMEKMGFMMIEYPNGNLIPPGQSIPVVMYWQPIFNPDGEEMTKETIDYPIIGCQDGAVNTIWDLNSAVFNNQIYNLPDGDHDAKLTHTFIDTIWGDGMDIPIKPDQPLVKMDVKNLTQHVYNTLTWLDVDMDNIQNGYRFLMPDGIWGGVLVDPVTQKPVPQGTSPASAFAYAEYLNPSTGLPCVPEYINHRFKPNPQYLFNAASEHPYQLTPFNAQYANPYMATQFYGNVLIKTNTLGNAAFTDINTYDDDKSDLVPCTSTGVELAGWILKDFWPVPGDFDASVKKLATENDYYFKRTVYVKNRSSENQSILFDYANMDLPGFAITGVVIVSPGVTLAPGAVAELEVTFKFRYTYQESGYLNMVKESLYIPRFSKV